MSSRENNLLVAALDYAARGLPVLPLHSIRNGRCTCGEAECQSPGKHPRTQHGLKDATVDRETIRSWWRKWADANVGMVTGAASGIVVLDVDPRHGGDYSLDRLEAEHGPLPATVESQTGGGGRHIFFRHPGGRIKSSSGVFGPGLDMKGDGGYVVAPPSCHVSGKQYEWELSSVLGEVEVAELPKWLLGLLRAKGSRAPAAAVAETGRAIEWVPEGQRNDFLIGLGGWLRQRGLGEDAIRSQLQAANEHICTPPLPDQEVTNIAKSAANYSPGDGRLVLSPRAPFSSAKKLLANKYTRDGVRILRCYGGLFLEWRDNAYRQKEDDGLRAEVYQFLGNAVRAVHQPGQPVKYVPLNPTKKDVDFFMDALKAEAHLPALLAPPAWLSEDPEMPPAAELLSCKSSLLHLPTLRAFPPTPKLFTMNALPADYDPGAAEPKRWLEFLKELWGQDAESIAALQQWFGYCLTPDTRQQKMLLLVGPKRSGKGTIGRVLHALLGNENVVSPTTSGLATQFGLQPLIGKSLAIVSDSRFAVRGTSPAIIERLLSISGEDWLSIPRKYLGDVTLKLPTRFMFLTNELPKLADASGALASRFVVLMLEKSFYGKEDLELTDKLLKEVPGILGWTIEGWQQLREQGRFKQPESALDAIRELEELASPVWAFVQECCAVGPQHSVETQKLYEAYRGWCDAHHRDYPLSDAAFGRSLRAVCPGIHKARPRTGTGTRIWIRQGIGLSAGPGPSRSMDQPQGLLRQDQGGEGQGHEGQERPNGPRTSLDQPRANGDEVVI